MICAMSDLERRSGSRPPRRRREQRAYNLVMAGGVFGLVAVVTGLLALFTSFGWGIPILAAILAVICSLLFRRAVR
jgi:membrane protein implicated in regulation of membrane protease activity